jgi:putative transposase
MDSSIQDNPPRARGGVVRKSRFSEEPIIAVLKESETGGAVPAARDHTGVCSYRWKSKFGGLKLSEAKRSRQLEEENRQLKYIVAEPAVDIRALKVGGSKKVVSPQTRRPVRSL